MGGASCGWPGREVPREPVVAAPRFAGFFRDVGDFFPDAADVFAGFPADFFDEPAAFEVFEFVRRATVQR